MFVLAYIRKSTAKLKSIHYSLDFEPYSNPYRKPLHKVALNPKNLGSRTEATGSGFGFGVSGLGFRGLGFRGLGFRV